MKIDALSVNAKILVGYVYTHQERYREAELLFVDAARSNPIIIWLWTNWGEMLELQGKKDQAIVRYREALARPVQDSQYNAARNDAYVQLTRLLIERKDLDGTESLYKARIAEFGPGSCYSNDYAKFKLYVRGDAAGAIALARGALEQDCDDAPSRKILGLASYVQWAQGTDPASADALNQARIFLPTSARAIYLLADNERTTANCRATAPRRRQARHRCGLHGYTRRDASGDEPRSRCYPCAATGGCGLFEAAFPRFNCHRLREADG